MVISMTRWVGKVAIVTGASSGIGAAIADALVKNGLIVAGLARHVDRIEDRAKTLSGEKGKLYAVKTDGSKEKDLLKAFKWINTNLGPVHILVNNAGMAKSGTLIDSSTEVWTTILDLNVLGLCIATREAIKVMKTNNINGHIVHINSLLGHRIADIPGTNVYPASKFAVTALTETLRQELNRLNSKIKVTSISPGLVETEAITLKQNVPEERKKFYEKLPILKCEDIADAVIYALSTPEHVQIHELTIIPNGANQEKMDMTWKKEEPIDIKEVFALFTTDVIGTFVFDLDCSTFKDDDSPFRRYGRKVFLPSTFRKVLYTSLMLSLPTMAKLFLKDVVDFFTKVAVDTINYREKNNMTRKDFMQMLIDLKNNKLLAEEDGYKHDGNTLTLDEITAHNFLFFLAGFKTSLTTVTFVLYELSKNQDIQDKVRNEINTVLAKYYDGKITYDAIQDMKYMNQVINETLRKYPPVPFVTRKCNVDYKVPDSDFIIEKGTNMMIPIIGIHYDKEHYPDPDRFNDEISKLKHQYHLVTEQDFVSKCDLD